MTMIMTMPRFPIPAFARPLAHLLAVLLLACMAGGASAQDADPPGRVAYLNHRQGNLSVSPSGDNSWYESEPNRPLVQGDRLWTDRNARAELYVGDIAVRMDEQTQLEISELDDQTLRLTLQQGRAQLRLRGDAGGEQERVELGTGNVAVVLRAPGDYRVQADPQADTTQVMVAHGNATVYGDGGQSQDLGSRQQAVYTGRDLTAGGAPQPLPADFDRWVAERNRLEDQSQSARYMSREIPGYMQLDQYGQWQNDPNYGAVWYPSNVASDWSPYSDGYWAVVAPWGYTWIDRAPWGFAPFHYGRWTRIGPRWCWVPGHRHVRPVYSPALVAFLGGGSASNLVVQGGRPAVGWFPLAPGDRWRPPYRASERYVDLANRTVVGGVRPAPAYANRALPNAVVAVPVERFGRGGPIGRRDFVRPAAPIVAAAQPSARPPMAWPTPNIAGRGTGSEGNTAYFGRRTQAAPPPVAAISPPQQPGPGRFQRDRDEHRPGRDDSLRQQQQQQRIEQQQQQSARQQERLQQMEQQRQQQEGSRQAQQEQARQQREAAQQQQQQARQQLLDQQQQQRQQRQDQQWMQRQQGEQRAQQDMRQQQQMQAQQRQQQMEQQRQQQEQQRIQQQQAQAAQRAQQEQAQAAQRAQQEQARQQAQMQRQQQQEQQQQRMQMEQQRMQQEQQRQQQQQMQAQQRQQQMEQQRQQQEQQQRMQQMQQQQAAQRAQQEQAQRQMQMHQQQMEQQRQMQMQQRQAEQMARQQPEMQQRAQQQAQQQAQRAAQQQQQQQRQQMQGGNRGRGPGDDNQRP